ncbi:MAG: OB-fold domain-containing protein [Actinobacteria bacterium]|nr:OB-fold domain-containing protein [Actinomycetota bacterium]
MNSQGKILTWTLIYVAGSDFKKYAPYPVVVVELKNGKKTTAQLVDYTKEDLKIGTSVTAVLRKVRNIADEDVIAYGIKFKPIAQKI